MEIKIKFTSSRKIHPKFQNLSIGKYTIEPLPSDSAGLQSATDEYLLRFQDEIGKGDHYSNPMAEGTLFLSCLSLLLGSKIQIESFMTNSVNAPQINTIGVYDGKYEMTLEELPDLNNFAKRLKLKDAVTSKQFLRACAVYQTAINLIGKDTTLSYFLLTIAIECLSNVVISESGKCDKFVAFILKYVEDKSDLKSEDEWKEFLKEVYYNHRSGFTHGGKDVPEGVLLADRLNKIYVKNVIDGKEVKTPGLKWFESVVRRALIGFLLSCEHNTSSEIDCFKEFSLERGKIMVKAKKALNALQIVTGKDIEHD